MHNENVDIQIRAHAAFHQVQLKIKRLESQIGRSKNI